MGSQGEGGRGNGSERDRGVWLLGKQARAAAVEKAGAGLLLDCMNWTEEATSAPCQLWLRKLC